MAKNDMLHKLDRQFTLDSFQIALHRQGWGYDRILDLCQRAGEVYRHYEGAFDKKNVEADVLREHMDAELFDIVKSKGERVTFEERYPEVYKITYGKR